MEAALQNIGINNDDLKDLCECLRQLIEISEGLYSKVSDADHPFDSDSFSRPAHPALQAKLPEFLQRELRADFIDFDAELRVEALHGSRDHLASELSKDLALLRHATDFVEDIARCITSDEVLDFATSPLQLFPACESENDQAFWQSHLDQVRDARHILPLYTSTQNYL